MSIPWPSFIVFDSGCMSHFAVCLHVRNYVNMFAIKQSRNNQRWILNALRLSLVHSYYPSSSFFFPRSISNFSSASPSLLSVDPVCQEVVIFTHPYFLRVCSLPGSLASSFSFLSLYAFFYYYQSIIVIKFL